MDSVNLGVIEQVNPAAKAMQRYLRDPSLVEADAKAAEAEEAKARPPTADAATNTLLLNPSVSEVPGSTLLVSHDDSVYLWYEHLR